MRKATQQKKLAEQNPGQNMTASNQSPSPKTDEKKKPRRPRGPRQSRPRSDDKAVQITDASNNPNQGKSSRPPRTRAKPNDSKKVKPVVEPEAACVDPKSKNQRQPQKNRSRPVRGAKHHGTRSDASTTPSTPAFSKDCLSCPICIEKFEEMELRFYPCPCGYRVCAMCIHLIKEKADGKCPSCREEYSTDRVRVVEEIPQGLLTVFRQASREEELEAKRAARRALLEAKRRSYRAKDLDSSLVNLKNVSPPSTKQSTPTVSLVAPPPVVRMTRFTGGLCVWD